MKTIPMQQWFSKYRELLSRACFLLVGIFNILRFARKGDTSGAVILFWSLYVCTCLGWIIRSFLKIRKVR